MSELSGQNNFLPAWWCRNRHLQTVWRRCFGETPSLRLRRERWETPDDDFLDLDFLETDPSISRAEKVPTVLFLHGLEGSSRAKYILGMLLCTQRLGWRGVALNFRSCSGEINRQARFYHSGETGDLDWVIRKLQRFMPDAPLFVVGFSLGGNVLLKWLGEQGKEAVPLVQAAVAISVPFDLGVAACRIDSGFGRIYGMNFLPSLKQKVLKKEAAQERGLVDPERVRRVRSYLAFEDEVFAPIHCFKDAKEYWKCCSAKNFLGEICRPTLILHAEDDPFLPGSHLPMRELTRSNWFITEITERGGHAGFVQGRWPWRSSYWAESRTMFFLSSLLKKKIG